MPFLATSLQHAVISRVIGLLRRNHSPDDVPAMREAMTRENRAIDDGPPRDVRRTHAEQISNRLGFPVHTLWRADGRDDAALDEERQPTRTLLYLHGGAYVKPSHPRQWRLAAALAAELGAKVVFPLYPLGPEFTVEDSFDQLLELYAEVAAASPDGVVLMGDSAGGGYALALAEAIRDAGGVPPERLVLLSPWVDLTGTTPGTQEAAARDPWLSYPHLAIYASFWAGSVDPAVLAGPRVSPGLGDLRGLPPALMLCGTHDLLHPGCSALFARAEEADWALTYVEAPGLIHVYPLLPVPEARVAFEQIVGFCSTAAVP